MMKENYLIKIIGTQIIDGESDSIEVLTLGSYELRNGKRYIIYKEYIEGVSEPKTTIVKFESESLVSIINPSSNQSRLSLETNKRHLCHYATPVGDLLVGVSTESIQSTLDDNGGTLEVKYTLDFNSNIASVNKFFIEVTKTNDKS